MTALHDRQTRWRSVVFFRFRKNSKSALATKVVKCSPILGHPELEFPGGRPRSAGLPLDHLPAISAAYCRSRCVVEPHLVLSPILLFSQGVVKAEEMSHVFATGSRTMANERSGIRCGTCRQSSL